MVGVVGVGRQLLRRLLPQRERCLAEGVPITPEAIEDLRQSVERPLAELRELPAAEHAEEALKHVHNLYSYHTGGRLKALRFARG